MSYDHQLDDGEKRELLRIARATLREHFRSGFIPPGRPHREALCRNAAVFVTLHRGGELRGCIGSMEADTPLYKAIQKMAVAAATRDSRFEPVTEDELPEIELEISVLGDHRPVSGPDDVEVGAHGLRITSGARRGLLLPQVASEHGWDAATFVAHVCRKAGLPDDGWRSPDAQLETFTAQVFNDTTHPPRE